jgi:hypothetical protein
MKRLLFVSLIVFSCTKSEPAPSSRSFYLGFTPFPYEATLEAVEFSYQKIGQDGDIINHHFDNGVPWVEAETNSPYHANVMNDWSYRKTNTPTGHKTYLSVGPINILRNGLANYRAEEDDMPLPAPWNTYKFSDQPVKAAYLNYCKRIVDFFKPDYFNMAIEANLLYFNRPELWNNYLLFHEYIFTQLKTAYPSLTIFSSVTGAHMLSGAFAGSDHLKQREAVKQVLAFSDIYALSLYPYLSYYLGNPYPSEMFNELFSISDKPIAFAETGYTAETFSIEVQPGTFVTISSDADKQEKYIRDLLEACTERNALFVINFVTRDYDQLWKAIGSPTDFVIAWKDTGLYDENGNTRKAYEVWKSYLAKPFKN